MNDTKKRLVLPPFSVKQTERLQKIGQIAKQVTLRDGKTYIIYVFTKERYLELYGDE